VEYYMRREKLILVADWGKIDNLVHDSTHGVWYNDIINRRNGKGCLSTLGGVSIHHKTCKEITHA